MRYIVSLYKFKRSYDALVEMIDNEWGMSAYPLVPGHEVVGRVVALGSQAKGLRVGNHCLGLVIVMPNAALDWDAIIAALGQKEIFGSPTGSPTAIARMLDFCAHHDIEPVVEMFPMSQVNEALDPSLSILLLASSRCAARIPGIDVQNLFALLS